MRITADIIDEYINDDCLSFDEIPCRTEVIQHVPVQIPSKEAIQEACDRIPYREEVIQHVPVQVPSKEAIQKVRDRICKAAVRENMLQKPTFRKKNRTLDGVPPEIVQIGSDADQLKSSLQFYPGSSASSSQAQLFGMQELNHKFQRLKLTNDPYSLNKTKESCEYAQNVKKFKNIYQYAQHVYKSSKMDDSKARGASSCPETPPPWLIQMMQKMKQEIKEEVLDELYGSAQLELYQIPSAPKRGEKCADDEVLHDGVVCDICDQNIRGVRYKCGNCADYDLCARCESIPNVHDKSHILMKIRYPVAFKPICQVQKSFQLGSSSTIPVLSSSAFPKNFHHKKFYDAGFLSDETIPDGSVLAPGTRFVKCWKVINCGKRVWTHATKLQLVQPTVLKPDTNKVDLPHLRPGEEGIVSVWFSTPSIPGSYKSYWNFFHKNRQFGNEIWCNIVVRDVEPQKLVETLQLPSDGLPASKEQDVVTITQVLTAVKEEHDRGNLVPRKLVVSSHTATPNNTPFDLTPPKSPDHHAVNDLQEVIEVQESSSSKGNADIDAEDESSVVSLSSSDSEAEFVVIPMPKCFNMSESVSSQHLSHLSQYLPPETVVNIKDLSVSEHTLATSRKTVPKSATFAAETVSQETGVPEFSSHAETGQKILISHNVSADGSSSSEVSVIESGSNSPTEEHTIPEIHVAITTDSQRDENKATEDSEETQPSSTTFPKFPVEGITTIYEPMSSDRIEQREQKTVQVLPEKLSTPIANAAVSLYQTAKGVISSLQNPARSNPGTAMIAPMEQLTEMGFYNIQQNEELLKKYNNDVARVVAELVSLNDNDWYASRHTPPSPLEFD